MLRYSGGLFEICSPYVYAVFRLIRYSDGLIDICSPYIVLRYGEQLSEIFLLCLKSYYVHTRSSFICSSFIFPHSSVNYSSARLSGAENLAAIDKSCYII